MPECAESGTMRAKATAEEEEEERRLSAAAPTCDKPFAIAKLQSNFAITVAILSREKRQKKKPRTASCCRGWHCALEIIYESTVPFHLIIPCLHFPSSTRVSRASVLGRTTLGVLHPWRFIQLNAWYTTHTMCVCVW